MSLDNEKNSDESFKKDVNIMAKTYFEARDRLVKDNDMINSSIKILSLFIFVCSILSIYYKEKQFFNDLLSLSSIIMSIYILIFLNSNNKVEKARQYFSSGNLLKDILRLLNNKEITLEEAQKRYFIIMSLNDNREDSDRDIAKADYEKITADVKKLKSKLACKRFLRYVITPVVIAVILLAIIIILNLTK